jgi:hypothetical protein
MIALLSSRALPAHQPSTKIVVSIELLAEITGELMTNKPRNFNAVHAARQSRPYQSSYCSLSSRASTSTREALTTIWPHEWCDVFPECMRMPFGPYLTKWNDDDELKAPSVFLHALSAVCKAWFDVMLLVPEFWMHLVILVADEQTSISAMRSQLSASRNLPFRAHIFNRQTAI